jgi:hypothetical protein
MSRLPAFVPFAWAVCAAAVAGAQQPKTDNAALVYWQAFALLGERLSKDDLEAIENARADEPVDARVAALLDGAGDALKTLHRGAATTGCDWGLHYADGPEMLMPHLAKARQLARIAVARARLSLERGRPAQAVADLSAVLRLGRHVAADRTLIGLLVSNATDAMIVHAVAYRLPTLDRAALDLLAAELTPDRTAAPLAAAVIRAEKSLFLDWFAQRATKAVDDPKAREQLLRSLDGDDPLVRQLKSADAAMLLRMIEATRSMYDEAADLMALPQDKFEAAAAALKKKIAGPEHALSRMLIPAYTRIRDVERRREAQWALLRAAIAVARSGPEALKDHKDPFGDASFAYRKTERGFELESKLLENGAAVKLVVGRGK